MQRNVINYSHHVVNYISMTYLLYRGSAVFEETSAWSWKDHSCWGEKHADFSFKKPKVQNREIERLGNTNRLLLLIGLFKVVSPCNWIGFLFNPRNCHCTLHNPLHTVTPTWRIRTSLLNYIWVWSDSVVFKLHSSAFEGFTEVTQRHELV